MHSRPRRGASVSDTLPPAPAAVAAAPARGGAEARYHVQSVARPAKAAAAAQPRKRPSSHSRRRAYALACLQATPRTTPTRQPSPRPPARTLLHARARARQGHAPPPGRATPRRLTAASVEWSLQALKQACSQGYPESAICVQSLDDSLDSAIRITYRISLRSSSLREPRHPPLKVFWMIVLGCLSAPQPRALPRGRHAPQRVDSFVFKNRLQSVIKVGSSAGPQLSAASARCLPPPPGAHGSQVWT